MMKKDLALRKKLDIAAYILSVVVIGLVIAMRPAERIHVSFDTSWMPAFHAICNTGVTIALLLALYFIKQKKIYQHRNMIFLAMFLSFLFLLSYVIYHFTTPETKFCKEGTIRYIYLFVLITHIILAGVSLPFILLTFSRGISFDTENHKKMSRWVFPVWLYVAITGPLVFLMLRPCYNT